MDTSNQLVKYSKRHRRQIKKTINRSKMTEEQIKEITEKFYKDIEEDNIKYKQELDAFKSSKMIPKKFTWKKTPKEEKQQEDQPKTEENIEIQATQLTPQGEIKTEIKTEDGITTIKKEETKKNDDGEIKITKKMTSSKVDELKETSLLNIMNNQDLIKNIENKSGNTFLLVGSSKSGKTTYLIELVNYLNDVYKTIHKKPIIILFSETMANDKGIYSRLPQGAILYDEYDESIINTIIKIQKKTNKIYPVIIILDDVINKQNPTISKLFTIYRNLNISTIICLQRLKMFSKNDRSNVNYIFSLKMNTNEAIQDMIDIFFKHILSTDDYINLTKNFNKIFLDNINGITYKIKS